MKNHYKVMIVILLLATASLACNAMLPLGTNAPLLEDNFDGIIKPWGTGTDFESSVEYANGGLRFHVYETYYFVWSNPDEKEYSNIRIEVTVKNNSIDDNAAFGILCNQDTSGDNLYYFAVTANGQYAIARGKIGQEDFFLTNDAEWGDSGLLAISAPSYQIAAECGNGTLTLFVDGREIDSVQDSTFSRGKIGLFAWSSDVKNGSDVTFDDILVTRLPAP